MVMEMRYLTRAEAAEFLKENGFPTAKTTLQKLACVGGGPLYEMYGNKALYTPGDLLEWAEGKLSAPRSSSSQNAA